MAFLPGAERAQVPDAKVTRYLLNLAHPEGGAKARFFLGFGFTLSGWQTLVAALLAHPLHNQIFTAQNTGFGMKYVVRCALRTPDGRHPCIISIWINDAARRPRLVTAYPAA